MGLTNHSPDIPSDHELDDILNGTLDGQDVFDTSNFLTQAPPPRSENLGTEDAGLGIDEEIKIVRKRQPIPKLDENRLLSDPGIPRLRRISKERLRLKGKGHEYNDIARMLNMYQLWLDDLYPRAKFADGLAMIEKLGHTKRIQLMRKDWIDELKPRHSMEWNDGGADATMSDGTPVGDGEQTRRSESNDGVEANHAEAPAQIHHADESINTVELPEGADPDEDELDALLAEGVGRGVSLASAKQALRTAQGDTEDPFADDMEALVEMGVI